MQLWTVSIVGAKRLRRLQTDQWGYRPWYSPDGQWIYFFSDVDNRHQICKIPAVGGEIIPITNDDKGASHGPFADIKSDTLLIHSTRDGKIGIWELPLNGTPARQIVIPEFDGTVAHATRAIDGVMAFDVYRQTFVRRIGSTLKRYVLQ